MKPFPLQGCRVDYGCRLPGPFAHEFCGKPEIGGAECPCCERPLMQLLSLDPRDPLLGAGDWGLDRVRLLYCWGCRRARGAFFYRLDRDRVVVRRRTRRDGEPALPYEDYPLAFPATAARLVPLPAEVQTHLRHLNRTLTVASVGSASESHQPHHQVGGEPLLLARWRTVTCPRCRKRMTFLAAVADDNLDARGFTGHSFAQVLFHLCRGCHTVGAYAQRL